jgi:hypothetical protein
MPVGGPIVSRRLMCSVRCLPQVSLIPVGGKKRVKKNWGRVPSHVPRPPAPSPGIGFRHLPRERNTAYV